MMAGADDKEWRNLAFLQREEKAPPRLCQKPSLGMRYMRKPWRVWLFYWVPAFETVQKTSLGYAGGKPNPLNPPYQGDFPLNSPYRGDFPLNSPYRGDFPLNSLYQGDFPLNSLYRGDFPLNSLYQGDFPLNSLYQGDFPLNSPLIRGARGVKNDERWVSYTVSFAGMTNIEFLHSLLRVKLSSVYGACVAFVDYLASKKHRLESQ